MQSCSTNENKSKRSIVNGTLWQNCSAEENELRSTKEDKPECAIKKKIDTNNEVAYAETKYFNVYNIFECGRDLLDILDVSYERACIAIQSTISDSGYFNSEKQVDAKRKLEEQVDAIRNSK